MGFEPMRNGCSTGSQGSKSGFVLANWGIIRSNSTIYLRSKRFSDDYVGSLLRYGDKYLANNLISEPIDIMRLFAKVHQGIRHLWLTFRVIFNYLESVGNVEPLIWFRSVKHYHNLLILSILRFQVNKRSLIHWLNCIRIART